MPGDVGMPDRRGKRRQFHLDKKVFALKLRWLRVSRGYTNQDAFAKAVGATRAAVNAWEGGRYIPNVGMLQKICEVLDCPREVLLDEEGIVAAHLIVPAIPMTRRGIPIMGVETDDADMFHSSLGQRIKHAREFRGLTQAALAAKIGVEPQTVSQWESDRRRPDAANLRRICCALDVSSDYLLGLIYKQLQRLPSGVEVGALMGW